MLRRSLLVLLLVAAAGVAVGATLAFRPAPEPREIVLVARDMSFYVEGQTSPNPTIQVRPREHVRFVLRNEARGFVHDLAIPAIGLSLEPLATGETRAVSVTIPGTAGSHPYVCRPHARMMRGTLVITNR